jgi:hypothetical protein
MEEFRLPTHDLSVPFRRKYRLASPCQLPFN